MRAFNQAVKLLQPRRPGAEVDRVRHEIILPVLGGEVVLGYVKHEDDGDETWVVNIDLFEINRHYELLEVREIGRILEEWTYQFGWREPHCGHISKSLFALAACLKDVGL